MSEPVASQIAEQAANLNPVGDAPTPAQLGAQAVAAGAVAGEVDTAALLRKMQVQQAQIDQLMQGQRDAAKPEVVKYAEAVAGHVQALAAANPVIDANPDQTYEPGKRLAAKIVAAANQAADTPDAAHVDVLHRLLDDMRRWVGRHSAAHPGHDYSTLGSVVEDTHDAANRLG